MARAARHPREAVTVALSHPDKVLFPDDGVTKRDLAAYYDQVADVLLPHLAGRPLTLERYPFGIAAKGFIQKDVSRSAPDWLARVEAPTIDGRVVRYALADSRDALRWLVNQNAIAWHVWCSRAPVLSRPDLCVIDVDPPDDDPPRLRAAMTDIAETLDDLRHPSWVKTSGSRGYHVVVRPGPRATFATSSVLAASIADALVARRPDAFTRAAHRRSRRGRIYLDVGRNHAGATFAAPYSVRARSGAPVSAPCTWDEVVGGRITSRSVTVRSLPSRLAELGDLWAPLAEHRSPPR